MEKRAWLGTMTCAGQVDGSKGAMHRDHGGVAWKDFGDVFLSRGVKFFNVEEKWIKAGRKRKNCQRCCPRC